MKKTLKIISLCLVILVSCTTLCSCMKLVKNVVRKISDKVSDFSLLPGKTEKAEASAASPQKESASRGDVPVEDGRNSYPADPTSSFSSTPVDTPNEQTPVWTPTVIDSSTEPQPTVEIEPAFGTQAWIKWLIEDDGETYNNFYSVSPYNITWYDGNGAAENYIASPWEVWPWDDYSNQPASDATSFQMCWMIEREECDMSRKIGTDEYEFIWEIWYRDADSAGDFKMITVAPWSVYNSSYWTSIIYRLKTWDAGMTDLRLNYGENEHEYEFVFVFYDNGRKAPENIIGWQLNRASYTNSTEKFIERALDFGLIDPA